MYYVLFFDPDQNHVWHCFNADTDRIISKCWYDGLVEHFEDHIVDYKLDKF